MAFFQSPISFSMKTQNGFVVKPTILHWFSTSCHLFLLLIISLVWISNKNSKKRLKNNFFLYYKVTLFTSLFLCLLYLLLGVYGFFVNRAMLAVEADLAVRAIAWFTIFLYLHLERRFSPFLRVWWALFFVVSIGFIVVDCVGVGVMDTQLWVFDIGSILGGLILCCIGWWVEKESPLLQEQEPLLDRSSTETLNTTSLFANAGFLSVLTFSWLGPLLAVGHKRTLDLKDVPQLAQTDSVNGIYPIFLSKLESCGSGGTSPVKLAKVLVASTWQPVVLTAFLAMIYTVALYVGPYLIDFFVQYLNGYWEFANEGYVLVLAFIVAKFFEFFSQRHWYFRLQQK